MPKAKQKIEITCSEIEYHDIDELQEYQGNLKELWKANAEKLWNQILKKGFADPIIIWKHEENLNIISGHQRKRILQVKREEGWTIPKIPCIPVKCENEKAAKELILAFVSQYGRTTDEGLYEFIIENQLDPEMLRLDFDIPDLNIDEFMSGYFEEEGQGEGDGNDEKEVDENLEAKNECPKCGYKW